MTAKVPLKETALNADRIGREVQAVCPQFDADGFVTSVMSDLPQLELGARIARTSMGLLHAVLRTPATRQCHRLTRRPERATSKNPPISRAKMAEAQAGSATVRSQNLGTRALPAPA
ncbi:hypothetical protein EDD95_4881 [Streptomyces sp. CEV 2-1]|uniref:hypothetical protein n=1 Tax=Streptomyces sp. CEV 2-1 TaxID=2485153 RepID=UPI000FBDE8CA|nr:hypothetical protein [Streptomyces sp. CEV 2-1]ROQ78276.1 hypothetical protein EDD95_4881 [Streptomyces sp. CEV 2-1]